MGPKAKEWVFQKENRGTRREGTVHEMIPEHFPSEEHECSY